ncbi:MAG: hypothetical protein ABFD25_16850 [Clostridiaceae bacterium]
MGTFIIVGTVSGILFGIMDGLINTNRLAQKLYVVYKPIIKSSVNLPAGIIIDLVYGFMMAGIFMLLFNSLPGAAGSVKGISFALIVWFFRVVMHVASQWMMFKVPAKALLYTSLPGYAKCLC